MKANELRIGNFVSDRLGIVIIGTNGRIEFADIYKPIPLTEEWLVKFGFVKNSTGNWFILENKFTNISLNLDGVCDIGSNEEYTLPYKIQHVHQLQNLYFALTGEELEPTR